MLRPVIVCALIAVTANAIPAFAQSRKAAQAAARKVEEEFRSAMRFEAAHALQQLEEDGNFDAAQTSLAATLDHVLIYADAADKALFRDAAFALRLVQQVGKAGETTRHDLLKFLLKNPELARALVFTMHPELDKPTEVFAVLDQLRAGHAARLNTYANLTAAICVVHDRPLARRINENKAAAVDPVRLFEFFVANENRMKFGLRHIPAELLIYVVDSTATLDEMSWALRQYAGDTNVGARFFDIEYDYDHFRKGDPKRVTVAGWNLQNMLKHGGVCADQAYFAMSIGKAIGVPTTYTRGRGGEVSHAWVGFLQSDGRRAWWNFHTGRYEAYQGVRGVVENPQTRQTIPDSYISLLAEFVFATELDRQAAAAITDAANRMIELQKKKATFTKPASIESELLARRQPQTADILALLEAGLTSCPGYAEGWFTVQRLAMAGQLSLADKKKWEGVLHRLCGRRYPDFYLAILGPMIETVEDVKDQNILWNAAFTRFPSRHDLAASVRMMQAEMWVTRNEPEKAGLCYEDVINRYANAGPFVIDALLKAEVLLRKARDGRRLLMLYERAWSQIKKPKEMAGIFFSQSNWYRVGELYAERLDEAGRSSDAAMVRSTIAVSSASQR